MDLKNKLLKALDNMMYKLPKLIFKNVPNGFTISRLISGLGIMSYLIVSGITNTVLMGLWFGATALTDFIDGALARRYNIESKFGALFDAISDKTNVAIGLVLIFMGAIPEWSLLLCLRDVYVSKKSHQYINDNNSKEEIKNKKINELDYLKPSIFAKTKMWLQSLGIMSSILLYNNEEYDIVKETLFSLAIIVSVYDMFYVREYVEDKQKEKLEREVNNTLEKYDIQEEINIKNINITKPSLYTTFTNYSNQENYVRVRKMK